MAASRLRQEAFVCMPLNPPTPIPNKTGKKDDVASSDGREQNVVFSWTVVIS